MIIEQLAPAGKSFSPQCALRKPRLRRAKPEVQSARNGVRQHDDRTVETHLHLQIALRPAVVGVSAGRFAAMNV